MNRQYETARFVKHLRGRAPMTSSEFARRVVVNATPTVHGYWGWLDMWEFDRTSRMPQPDRGEDE